MTAMSEYVANPVDLDCTRRYCFCSGKDDNIDKDAIDKCLFENKCDKDLSKYKLDEELVETAINDVVNSIREYEGRVLFIVNCTEKKAWKTCCKGGCFEKYIPAECAYCGSSFIRFKKFLYRLWNEMKNDEISYPIYWVILSAKYGFIEPDHPIHEYNVTLSNDETGPIDLVSLIRQAKYQTRILHLHEKDYKKLIEFDKIYVYSNDIYYLIAVAIVFGAKTKRLLLTKDDNKLGNTIKDFKRLNTFLNEYAYFLIIN